MADEKNYKNASHLRTQIVKLINGHLTVLLLLLKQLNEVSTDSFAQTLNQLITDSNELVSRRSNKEVKEMT